VFERLSGERLDAVLRWANDHYDFVVIDGPPSVVASEALTIANKVDASMIVTRAWKDQRGLVMKLAGQLLESRSQFLGVMLNRMRMTAGGYLRKNAEAMAEYAEHTTAFGGTDTVAEQTKRKAKPKAT
jgi:Mrp family chromosome partitioning ATPase